MMKYLRYALNVVARSVEDLRSEVDRVRFDLREPNMRGYSRGHVLPLATELRGAYCRYMAQCTRDDYPITMGQACFMLAFLRSTPPRRILDLGSGFSSYVFARYAAELPPAERPSVYAVDDSAFWLERTREFLDSEGIDGDLFEGFADWNQLCEESPEPFDFINVDIGTLEFRGDVIGQVLTKYLSPQGRGFVDDMHFPEYRRAALAGIRRAGCASLRIPSLCGDEYQKVAFVVYKAA